MRICVYGAASPTIDSEYKQKVEKLGEEMVAHGHSLVFGGGAHGLMGAVARGVRASGGRILGVIPRFFEDEDIEQVCNFCDELIETDTMRERKQIMEDNADAFLIVPGGIGTFEEFFEILTLKQLCRHNKPIAVYNVKGYYDEIMHALEKATEKNFIRGNCMALFFVSEDLNKLFSYIERAQGEEWDIKDLKDG